MRQFICPVCGGEGECFTDSGRRRRGGKMHPEKFQLVQEQLRASADRDEFVERMLRRGQPPAKTNRGRKRRAKIRAAKNPMTKLETRVQGHLAHKLMKHHFEHTHGVRNIYKEGQRLLEGVPLQSGIPLNRLHPAVKKAVKDMRQVMRSSDPEAAYMEVVHPRYFQAPAHLKVAEWDYGVRFRDPKKWPSPDDPWAHEEAGHARTPQEAMQAIYTSIQRKFPRSEVRLFVGDEFGPEEFDSDSGILWSTSFEISDAKGVLTGGASVTEKITLA